MLSYLLFSIFIVNINGYLYDLRHTIVVNTNSVSKDKDCFGYSLDFSKDSYGNPWLLVGAPKGQLISKENSKLFIGFLP